VSDTLEPPIQARRSRTGLRIALIALAGLGALLLLRPPVEVVPPQQFALRINHWTSTVDASLGEARVWVIPGMHSMRSFALDAQSYQPWQGSEAGSESPPLSSDGLGVDVAIGIRWQPDAEKLAANLDRLPGDLQRDLVRPLVHAVVRRQMARHTLAELFSGQQNAVKLAIQGELAPLLEREGLLLRDLSFGEIGLSHNGQRHSLQDRSYRPHRFATAGGDAPLQSSEGLSLGMEMVIRYALDAERLPETVHRLPADIDTQLVDPLVQGVIYKALTRYTMREIFSTKRQELQESIELALAPLMAKDGLVLRSVMLGNVDLPPDFRAGMDRLLAAELANEQMQHTLQLKQMQVKETELQAEAEKVRREKAAEAAAREQVIAAKAQEEAMRHVLPFKQKQVEQRQLEAEAERTARVKTAEGMAEARKIEAAAEAESRQKLADAEAYRLEQIGRVNSVQLERDGELISRYPLLIQKTMADKLSDKVSVIIAAPPADGGFIGSNLLGKPASGDGSR
jgi:regulator of protease activity HflC (stomatin/prohibitin superfamily)